MRSPRICVRIEARTASPIQERYSSEKAKYCSHRKIDGNLMRRKGSQHLQTIRRQRAGDRRAILQSFRVLWFGVNFELPRGLFQFAAQDAHVSRRFHCDCNPVTGNPPDLEYNVVSDM